MSALRFRLLKIYLGWLTFSIALLTYSLTVERTASFWDCGEFIASAYKLQVPHPPGAPLFLLLGRIFSLLSFGNTLKVAFWINMVSATASAFTILFLFWTIILLGQKLLKHKSDYTLSETIVLYGSAFVGALSYTFSDTFWFSAGEAEVYGMSSFFTAIVVWAALEWELIDDESKANRWLIMIAYLIGLSIGVHLLNLVTLPALALIYYFKKHINPTIIGGFIAFVIGMFTLGVINSGIIPGLPSLAFAVERFFVNNIGLPFNSGIFFTIIFVISFLFYGIYWSIKHNKPVLNTSLLSLAFVLIGYISYTQVIIRANYNTPINENNPDDALNFIYYLKREQYGSRSLLYGSLFTSHPIDQKKGSPIWKKEGNKYVIFDYQPEYIYQPGDEMLFPRVYSSQQNHPQLYRQMLGLAEGQKPTMGDNLKFLFNYQLGHMWWRYLMWNFAGRESDEEGAGYLLPWSSDENVPELLKSNKAHDNFYMLPFLLGLFGLVMQYMRSRRDSLIIGLLFFFTGIALQIFLNSPPSEPRERDYIYVGSFYFFAIWVGLGVIAIAESTRHYFKASLFQNCLVVGICLFIPVMMGVKSWDNHDRSKRYHSVDFAKNLLNSCAPNAILFTGGDNDTFPLWYVQEVEGFRRDVRVCNLSLLGTDWYIQQMKRKSYESEALPISLELDQFNKGKNDIIPFYEVPVVKNGIDLKQYINLIKTNSSAIQVPLTTGNMTSVLPSSVLFLAIDKAAIEKANFVPITLRTSMRDTLQWTIGKKDLYKPDLIILDMIATNNWQRPIYFANTLANDNYLNLKNYMQLEGYAYRLMPVAVPGATDGYVNSSIMYDNMMKKMAYRELNNAQSYYPKEGYGTAVLSGRISFLKLAEQLIREGKTNEAEKVLNYSLKKIPDSIIPLEHLATNYVRLYFAIGNRRQALSTANIASERTEQNLNYLKLTGKMFGDANTDLYILQSLIQSTEEAGLKNEANKFNQLFEKYASFVK